MDETLDNFRQRWDAKAEDYKRLSLSGDDCARLHALYRQEAIELFLYLHRMAHPAMTRVENNIREALIIAHARYKNENSWWKRLLDKGLPKELTLVKTGDINAVKTEL